MGCLKKIRNLFCFFAFKGKNNKVIAIKNNKEYKIWYSLSKVKIKGDNNTIILDCNKFNKISRVFPEGLNIKIEGNNSKIEIELPVKFTNANLRMYRGNSFFSIKSTKNKVANVNFNVSDGSSLIIGKDSEIGNGDLRIICKDNFNTPHKVVIGDGVHIARDVLIRMSDGQCLINPETKEPLNEPQDIIIGDNVWIMSRCMVIKGARIPKGSAVAPYSFVNKEFNTESVLLAGIPAKIKKENIKWLPKNYREYMEEISS